MNALGVLLGNLFGALFQVFGTFAARRVAIILAAVAAMVTVTGVMTAAVAALLTGLSYTLPEWAATALNAIMPSNTSVCLGALASAELALYVYRYHLLLLQTKAM